MPPSVKVLIGQLVQVCQAAEELKQQQTLEEELFPTFPKTAPVKGGKDTSPRFSTDRLKQFDKIRKEEARKLEESLMKADQAQLDTILEIENSILAEQSRNVLENEEIFTDLEKQTEAAERMKEIFGESKVLEPVQEQL